MKGFNRIVAVIIGIVFFVAGVLKLMDPLGTSLITGEYLKFFHLGFLRGIAKFLGMLLAFLETVVGAALITGIWRKLTSRVSGIMILFFTLITLILLIANPNMDCGCFGEALHLTHSQTFIKNIVLALLWMLAFYRIKDFGKPQRIKYASFALAVIAVCLFTFYSSMSIPLQDFTEMKPGTELLGAADDNFDDITAYIYEKNGHEGAFTPDCPPDSSWTFVREETYDRGIAQDGEAVNLSFSDAEGEYADSLATEGPVIVISSYYPDKLNSKQLQKLSSFAAEAEGQGYTVLFLGAGIPESIASEAPALLANSYSADPRMLMSLNRSNGGVTYINDGQIVRKWAARAIPSKEELGSILEKDPTEYMLKTSGKGKVYLQGFLLYTFAVMILL